MAPRKGSPVPAPRKLKLLKGVHPARINDHEPTPRKGSLVPPDHLSADVRAIWDFTVAELRHMGTAEACDRDVLVAYCEAVVSHRRACEILAKSDLLVKTARNGVARNPALAVQRDAAYAMRMFAQEFGLTPSGRTRIVAQQTTVPDQSNPFSGAG